jgi:hypothetical protein
MLPVAAGKIMRWGTGFTVEEFWEHASPEPNTGCWIYSGPVGTDGYAQAKVCGVSAKAHHHAVYLTTGKWPKRGRKHAVRHTCDNMWCVNPQHLIPGTQRQNVRDKYRHSAPPAVPPAQHRGNP